MALPVSQHASKPRPKLVIRRSPPKRFRREDLVEVASNDEGFVGSYFEATVVADHFQNCYVVQYRTLVKDDLSGAPLREVVPAAEVRPRPPVVMADEFRLHDVVDAFDNDGWWVGKIIGRVGDKYRVYFDYCNGGDEIIAYDKDQLRVHQDWINGKWVYA